MKRAYKYLILFSFYLATSVAIGQVDEFSEFEDSNEPTEVVSEQDEFGSDDEFGGEDEFGESSDEFSEFTEGDVLDEKVPISWNRFFWAIGILGFTILAGVFVRYEKTRKLRALFLLAAVVILGFYRGGPGIISSFQNTYLFAIGATLKWPAIILFLGLLPITYFFGKVFCGWTCYLGAIQEFLYIGKFKIFQSEKAQKTMRIIRYVVLGILLVQLTITQGIEWSKIGPFKVIFNLFSPNLTGYILLVVLLVSSLFIHRPFCKVACPAGLIFGWVTKLPGASVLGITDSCAGCKTCDTACHINAITREGKTSTLDNQECIMCGDCMSDCKIKSIHPFKKGENHHGRFILKGIKKLDIN
ncbi:MAG: 4Fe-4S binding protein [Bacteroidales bacterium]|nr:4Fe-4S binding protein [Bacteroidales bacterium]